MKVIVCGSRDWVDPEPIRRELEYVFPETIPWTLPADITVIHGDAAGADRLAGRIAAELGFKVIAVPADWETYGKAAGPRRNQKMLKMLLEGDDERLILAFHEDLPRSKGTKDMIQRAIAAGVKVVIVSKPRQRGYGARLARTLQP